MAGVHEKKKKKSERHCITVYGVEARVTIVKRVISFWVSDIRFLDRVYSKLASEGWTLDAEPRILRTPPWLCRLWSGHNPKHPLLWTINPKNGARPPQSWPPCHDYVLPSTVVFYPLRGDDRRDHLSQHRTFTLLSKPVNDFPLFDLLLVRERGSHFLRLPDFYPYPILFKDNRIRWRYFDREASRPYCKCTTLDRRRFLDVLSFTKLQIFDYLFTFLQLSLVVV